MTISSANNKRTFSGDGTTKTFQWNFMVNDADHLQVWLEEDSSYTLQTLNSDYVINSGLETTSGEIEFSVAPTSDQQVILLRELPLTQETDYPEYGPLSSQNIEDNMDNLTMMVQQLQEQANRAVAVGLTDDPIDIKQVSTDAANAANSANIAQGYASDASGYATTASGYSDDAHSYANEAEASAAGVNLPSIEAGDANKILSVLANESGYELIERIAVLAQDQQTLTDGANISWDMSSGGYAEITLGGDRTLDNPTNVEAGGLYRLTVIQDATGSRTLSYGANFQFPGGTEPTLSSGANDVDILEFLADDSTTLRLVNAVFDVS